jgi:hypothetical protein
MALAPETLAGVGQRMERRKNCLLVRHGRILAWLLLRTGPQVETLPAPVRIASNPVTFWSLNAKGPGHPGRSQ